jgi:hypothetical protein
MDKQWTQGRRAAGHTEHLSPQFRQAELAFSATAGASAELSHGVSLDHETDAKAALHLEYVVLRKLVSSLLQCVGLRE